MSRGALGAAYRAGLRSTIVLQLMKHVSQLLLVVYGITLTPKILICRTGGGCRHCILQPHFSHPPKST
jgi:hypothetical protein